MVEPHFLKRICTFVLGLFTAFLLSIIASLTINMGATKYIYLFGCISIIAYFIYVCIIIQIWKKKFKQNKEKISTKSKILWLVVGVVIMIIINIFFNNSSNPTPNLTTYNLITLICIFVLYVGFAPIVEETICRGWFLSLFFQKRYNTNFENVINVVGSCMVSAYISTMMHGIADINIIIPMFINGIIAAVLYLKTNTILIPIIFHMSVNFLAFIALLINIF